MLPYKMLATFLTIVRQEEVRLRAGACYCIFSLEYFHQNACTFVLVLGYFFRSLVPVDICVCPLNLADISC